MDEATVPQNDEVVDEYVITAIEIGDGCLIEFTPDKVIGNKTRLSIVQH